MKSKLIVAALSALCTTATLAADSAAGQPSLIDRLDVGLSVGTMGPGGQVSWLLVPGKLSVRVAANAFNYNHDTTSDNVDYTGKLKLKSELLLLDWHPFEGRFRLSGGMVANGNKFDLQAKPAAGGTYEINGKTYTAAQVGTLAGKVSFPSSAPYLGIGWGDSTQTAGLHFIGDIGVIVQGSPKAKLTATGALASDPQFSSDLKQAETDLQTKLNDFKYYPLVQLGIAYRF